MIENFIDVKLREREELWQIQIKQNNLPRKRKTMNGKKGM